MLFSTPALDELDESAIADIDRFRRDMRFALREPKRWTGQPNEPAAKAIQGSNSIEGYNVSDEDAVAAVEEEVDFQRTTRPGPRFEDTGPR